MSWLHFRAAGPFPFEPEPHVHTYHPHETKVSPAFFVIRVGSELHKIARIFQRIPFSCCGKASSFLPRCTKMPERNLVVSIDAHVLALGPLNPINQFGCAVADIWDDILSKNTFDVGGRNLPPVLLFLLFCRMCLQAGDKEHGIRVHVEITMKGSDVPLGSCIPRRLDGIFPSILGAKKTSSQWPKHPLLPVVGEEGPCPRVSFLLLRGQRGLFCWSPGPNVVPIVRTYANQMQGQMCAQKINKLLTIGSSPFRVRRPIWPPCT